MRKPLLSVLAAGLATAAAAGCGDGDADEARAPEADSPSKSEYVRRANELCAKSSRELLGPKLEAFQKAHDRRLEKAIQRGREPPEFRYEEKVVVPEVRRLIEKLRALPPPEADEEKVEAMLAAAEHAMDQLENEASSVKRIRPPFLVEFRSRTLDEAHERAGAYGLDKCAPGASGS